MTISTHRTDLVLRGMSVDSVPSVRERKEYVEVRGRLVDADDAEGSSSESASGNARFLPLGSRTGSLITKALEVTAVEVFAL